MADDKTGAPEGMEPAAGSMGAPAAVAEPSHDKGDYKARLTHEPDFAASEVTRLTSELEKAKQSTRAADPILNMAKTVANGDVEQGIRILEQAIQNQSRIVSDPKMSKVVSTWLNGGDVPSGIDADDPSDDIFSEDFEKSSVVRELRQELAAVKGQTAQQTAQANLKDFFDNTEEGRVLNTDERGEVLTEIQNSIQRAQNSGQSALLNDLSKDTIRTIVANWMSRSEKLGEVGERIARARAEAKNAASTGEPPSPIGTGLQTKSKYSDNLAEAVAQFAKENEVDLYNLKIR